MSQSSPSPPPPPPQQQQPSGQAVPHPQTKLASMPRQAPPQRRSVRRSMPLQLSATQLRDMQQTYPQPPPTVAMPGQHQPPPRRAPLAPQALPQVPSPAPAMGAVATPPQQPPQQQQQQQSQQHITSVDMPPPPPSQGAPRNEAATAQRKWTGTGIGMGHNPMRKSMFPCLQMTRSRGGGGGDQLLFPPPPPSPSQPQPQPPSPSPPPPPSSSQQQQPQQQVPSAASTSARGMPVGMRPAVMKTVTASSVSPGASGHRHHISTPMASLPLRSTLNNNNATTNISNNNNVSQQQKQQTQHPGLVSPAATVRKPPATAAPVASVDIPPPSASSSSSSSTQQPIDIPPPSLPPPPPPSTETATVAIPPPPQAATATASGVPVVVVPEQVMPTAPSKALPIPPPLLPSKPADTITAAINEGENDTGVEVKEEGGEGGEEEEEEDPSTSSSPPLYSVAVNSDGEEIDGEGEDEEVADEEAAKAAAEKEEEERRKKKAAEDEDLAKIKPESLIYTKKEIGLLQDVLDVFIEKSPAAIELMFEKVGKEKLDEFANALVTLTFAHSTTLALVLYFVGEEFARNGHSEGGIKVLFRENSVASKMLKAYIQHVGGQYLQELLGGLIRDVCYVEQKVSFEIDPSRAEGGAAEVERNLAQLLAKLEAVMGRITSGSMVARMPQGIRAIAAYFAESSRRYWPDKPSDILLGSFLMLRYINPAIAAPETAGLLPRSGRYAGQPLTPRARRNLLLITKVLQNMSNGVLFTQKEQYMLPLNPFLQAYTPRLQRYYQSIVAAAGACSTNLVVDSDIAAPGPREAYDLHRLLFAARDEVAHLLTGTADRARLDALLDALGPYTRKASFPRVIGAEPAAQARVRQLLAKYNDAPVFVAPYETAPEPVTSLAIYASRNPESSTSSITTTSTVTLPPIGGDNSNNNSGVCNNEDDDDDDDEAAAASGDNVVIVGSNRVFVVRKKPLKGSILKCGGHLLDLTEIRSRTPRELTFTFKTFSITGFCDASSEVIECAVRAYMANFACAPPAQRFRVAIAPPPRAEAIASTLAAAEAAAADAAAHTRGCAGLLGTYMSLCDYYGQPANESVCWDLENLYENDATLDLRRFGFDEGAEQEELVPLFHALRYDSHFTGLASDGVRLKGAPSAVVLQLGETLRLNSSLTSLTIADAALPDKAAVVLFDALTASAAAACAITALDVSGNAIEEKGAAALGRFVCARAAKSSSGGGKDSGLVSLNVEDALTSTKAVAALGTELVKSVRATLRTLNVSQNKIGDAYAEIGAFLQSPGGGAEIVDLDISGTFLTGQKLTGLLHAIAKGCKRLARLGAANVKFSKPEDLLFISQMLISNNTLRDLDLAGSLPSARFLGDLISCAPADAALRISIADNTFSESAALFYQVLPKVQTLAHLDLSNTDLGDDGVFHVAENLTLNTALRSLNISGCFRADKRPRLEAIHALEKLVNSDCPLEALYIAGGQKTAQQIGKFLPQLLQAFRTNKTIATLDVSAHAAGPRGALAMSKLLMINKTLTDIRMEQNNIGVNGLSVLAQSLKASHSVVSFPLPIIDIASMLSGSSSAVQKKIHTLCVEIEKSVISNNSSNSSSSSVGNTTTSNSSNNNNNNGNRK